MRTRENESIAPRLVVKELEDRLQDLGFIRVRSTFFVRVVGDFVEFFHLHKFRGSMAYRVHCGTRALDDTTHHAVLNGPDSDSVVSYFPNPLVPQRRYQFNFGMSPDSVSRCAESMFEFCQRIGESWFKKWRQQHSVVGLQISLETKNLFRLHLDESPA